MSDRDIEDLNEALSISDQENLNLRNVIKWALGEVGDFPERPCKGPWYWWRHELRQRFDKACSVPSEALPSAPGPDALAVRPGECGTVNIILTIRVEGQKK